MKLRWVLLFASLASPGYLGCEDPSAHVATPAPVQDLQPAVPTPSAPPAAAPARPNAPATAPTAAVPEPGAAPPLDGKLADMRGHPCECGKECHCGHCSGVIPGCHCRTKRADGKAGDKADDKE